MRIFCWNKVLIRETSETSENRGRKMYWSRPSHPAAVTKSLKFFCPEIQSDHESIPKNLVYTYTCDSPTVVILMKATTTWYALDRCSIYLILKPFQCCAPAQSNSISRKNKFGEKRFSKTLRSFSKTRGVQQTLRSLSKTRGVY